MSKTSNLGLSLKFSINNKDSQVVRFRRKQAFVRFIEANMPETGQFSININYGKSGAVNSGDYSTKKDLIFAYQSFTEQSLVDFLQGGKSGN